MRANQIASSNVARDASLTGLTIGQIAAEFYAAETASLRAAEVIDGAWPTSSAMPR